MHAAHDCHRQRERGNDLKHPAVSNARNQNTCGNRAEGVADVVDRSEDAVRSSVATRRVTSVMNALVAAVVLATPVA